MKNPIGISKNRKDWVYNFSIGILSNNIKSMIEYYDAQRKLFKNKMTIEMDSAKIKWTEKLIKDAESDNPHFFQNNVFRHSLYTPFAKTNIYYYKPFIERTGTWDEIIPKNDTENLIIIVPRINNRRDFCVLLTNNIPDLNNFDGGTQFFPLYWYEKKAKVQNSLFEQAEGEYFRHDAISDFILEQAKTRYGLKVTKEDIFYIYLRHTPQPRLQENFCE